MSLVDSKIGPNGVRYREYEGRDFARLCELDRICFPPAIAYAPEEIAAALTQPGAFALVAEVRQDGEDLVIGFVLAGQRRRLVGHIITIDIHPEFRSRGVGGRLMEMAERRLAGQGVGRVVLEAGVHNESAISFYSGRGYKSGRVLRRYYRDGSDAYLMEKAL